MDRVNLQGQIKCGTRCSAHIEGLRSSAQPSGLGGLSRSIASGSATATMAAILVTQHTHSKAVTHSGQHDKQPPCDRYLILSTTWQVVPVS